jgi:hypothetical protein
MRVEVAPGPEPIESRCTMTRFELPGRGARPGLIAGLVALTVALASGAVALAMAPYTVHVAVPATVKKGHDFKLTASGESANLSRLTVFLDSTACAPTASREHAKPTAKLIISKDVVNKYTKSATLMAKVLGKHHACGYLTGTPPQSLPRAHSFATYKVVT